MEGKVPFVLMSEVINRIELRIFYHFVWIEVKGRGIGRERSICLDLVVIDQKEPRIRYHFVWIQLKGGGTGRERSICLDLIGYKSERIADMLPLCLD